ncbi:trifunctional transcriptional activator/DNA repair protein Ada/methylated-DNA--[protein]-cysteine S-methyltransferase [Ruegeria sp. 2205SS24-7]|uniref:bifunctional transcriptional activator/DNA repair enzyme AdaA n=1 Tax=Ruegeria discodermiae TaxID=3064389 RepID=UPI002740EB43|nr:trifunctional transcriptional activator/DNA repair protein Ada/methylated-DNA--[protein]-cysteine S-methyltransferase [Ruegeria sp. 2205SS24-7]MDP5219600.1 trifunctional transcriptional activator/DNA repair protein Ada/methylated-DNA--[protein]-cysteine S-methyltransferase [Ruegeria sp. 2205SS24-7]
MQYELPDDDTLYAALLTRDPSWDGRAYVGVSSTGIFCRLTCPARKPKRAHCHFFTSVADCLSDGYRPCKRCHPMNPSAETEPLIKPLLAALEANPARRWREEDLVAMGHDPSTVRRAFKRQFGQTFLDLARQMRLQAGLTTLAEGGRVIDAQIDAGFSSPAAFRTAVANHLGLPPGAFRRDALLRADWIDTPLGAMIAVSDKSHLHLLEFTDRKALPTELKRLYKSCKGSLGLGRFGPIDQAQAQLSNYFEGRTARFDLPLALHGSPFTQKVWKVLQELPAGTTHSYSEIARRLGRPYAVRAVARANGANQIAIVIPCHRVLGADGSLTGYGGGLWRKQKLIEIERHYAPQQKEHV